MIIVSSHERAHFLIRNKFPNEQFNNSGEKLKTNLSTDEKKLVELSKSRNTNIFDSGYLMENL